ncbi:kinase-like domain-containing protein [Gamsiella multidivaricata]|uniref:kinase-like domain-containing protein n=1 Tax=Gamsiella multidivaricata TaxID=101098 RepID=UPI00221FFDEE|nr:kinase-like domain-containing protein [Gamsiella multidivaricata]KAI7829591.1 kinase-like domain-containing protein [Gamsiella multidivaricata]
MLPACMWITIDVDSSPFSFFLCFLFYFLFLQVEVMRICGNHNNIVEFYGIATRQQQHQVERFMIMRYYERGDLVRLLERPQNPSEAPTLIDKLFLALDIAMGLEHLFRCGFHHGDLHPKNVLIDGRRDDSPSSTYYRARYQARLTDFGLRRIRDNRNAYSSQPLAGVQQFMAPERMYKNRPRYNVRCDIFALGVIYWYLIAERYPFKNSPILIPGQREERVEGTPDWYHALYTQAWHEDPNQRQQSLEEIIQVLHYQLRVSAVPFPTTGYQQYENSLHDRSAAAAAAYPTPSSGHDSLAPPSIPGYDRTHQQFFFPSVSGTALRGGPMGHQNLAVPPLYSGAPSSASAGPSTGASNMPSPTLTQTIASKASAAKSTNPSHPRNRKVVVPNGMPARGGYR